MPEASAPPEHRARPRPDAALDRSGVGCEDFESLLRRAMDLLRHAETVTPVMHPNVELLVGMDLRAARGRVGSVLGHLRREGINTEDSP